MGETPTLRCTAPARGAWLRAGATARTRFNSINLNHNWVLGGSKLNEFVFQYADFGNQVTARTGEAQQSFPNGVTIGYNTNTPQTTEQKKWQFRDDFSWSKTGMGGLGHDFKAGVNYINEPHLYVTFSSGSTDYAYTHLDLNQNGPISSVSRNKPGASANLPMKQFGMYIQDDWRVNDRLTVNAGLRYDVVTGFDLDQSQIPNFIALTGAAAAGRFNGVPGFEEFGKATGEDYNNWQPRIGAVYDLRGDGKDVIRAGWGVYYDFGYTNANILFPGLSVQGGSGVDFHQATNTAGIRNPDGTFFTFGQPVSNIAGQNEVNPNGPFYSSNVAAPGIEQPWTSQTSAGWSHELTPTTVIDVDYVHIEGRDLGVRWALNTRVNGGARRYADLNLNPANPTMNMSVGASKFDGLNIGVRRRLDKGISFNAWYSLSNAKGLGGLGVDELTTNLVQDSFDPYADDQMGSGGAHRRAPQDLAERGHPDAVGHLCFAGLPLSVGAAAAHLVRAMTITGRRQQRPLPDRLRVHGRRRRRRAVLQGDGRVRDGELRTRRGTLDVQPAGVEGVPPPARDEHRGDRRRVQPLQRDQSELRIGAASSSAFFTGTAANHVPNTVFMKPTAYSGDAGQPEQRVGQIGFRFTF